MASMAKAKSRFLRRDRISQLSPNTTHSSAPKNVKILEDEKIVLKVAIVQVVARRLGWSRLESAETARAERPLLPRHGRSGRGEGGRGVGILLGFRVRLGVVGKAWGRQLFLIHNDGL